MEVKRGEVHAVAARMPATAQIAETGETGGSE